MPGNDVAITWFIENVATMYCDYELSRLKEEATDRAWTENDLRDVWALCSALVYTDVVVTEKSWALETEKANTAVIVCARCGEEAAAIDDGARCLFCGYATGAEDTAHQYASDVLGITLYESGHRRRRIPDLALPVVRVRDAC
jgi:ribosomal protein L37E